MPRVHARPGEFNQEYGHDRFRTRKQEIHAQDFLKQCRKTVFLHNTNVLTVETVPTTVFRDSLLLRPSLEQHNIGHSGRGKYNSAYSIGFVVNTYPSRVGLWFELEMDWPPQPLHSCAPSTYTYVSNLPAISDTRWRSMAGRAVKYGN
ncbi:hypothetical protein TIFTF001_042085 [Ficus carica]|uniref:Uncharacterized protein n=1 Tax=Ficus carica TaxID=3494 RepID=A0AA87ZZE2_FICCA|nr:hypothetical protein TIFTF001_042082 [Ficus carica]GMN34593.1 hypothetical protein TIFTF001_042083 [Ficus carica]GMN34596.1 hypothetical protein TIFTF001_042084 [Ficus carica]GMN34597.1 hypothetical protein TIFTF001_042085 [Ficus carica]